LRFRAGTSSFAHVVEENGPTQPVPSGLNQPQLLGDEVVEGSGPLGVPPGGTVVAVEGSDQGEDARRVLCRLVVDSAPVRISQLFLEVAGGARSEATLKRDGARSGKTIERRKRATRGRSRRAPRSTATRAAVDVIVTVPTSP